MSTSVVLWGNSPQKHTSESSVSLSAQGICFPGRPSVPLRSICPLSLDLWALALRLAHSRCSLRVCQTTLRSGHLVTGSVLGRCSAGPDRTSLGFLQEEEGLRKQESMADGGREP